MQDYDGALRSCLEVLHHALKVQAHCLGLKVSVPLPLYSRICKDVLQGATKYHLSAGQQTTDCYNPHWCPIESGVEYQLTVCATLQAQSA